MLCHFDREIGAGKRHINEHRHTPAGCGNQGLRKLPALFLQEAPRFANVHRMHQSAYAARDQEIDLLLEGAEVDAVVLLERRHRRADDAGVGFLH